MRGCPHPVSCGISNNRSNSDQIAKSTSQKEPTTQANSLSKTVSQPQVIASRVQNVANHTSITNVSSHIPQEKEKKSRSLIRRSYREKTEDPGGDKTGQDLQSTKNCIISEAASNQRESYSVTVLWSSLIENYLVRINSFRRALAVSILSFSSAFLGFISLYSSSIHLYRKSISSSDI